MDDVLEQKWAIGAYDRGHGHMSFAVLVEDTEELVVKASSLELAEHIVKIHNEELEWSDSHSS